MRISQAKGIHIRDYLELEGILPAKERLGGMELRYNSPLRHGDTNPSFKVDTRKNLWFDHGLSDGGDIVKLVCELRQTTVS